MKLRPARQPWSRQESRKFNRFHELTTPVLPGPAFVYGRQLLSFVVSESNYVEVIFAKDQGRTTNDDFRES
jgi:hypothetical protein